MRNFTEIEANLKQGGNASLPQRGWTSLSIIIGYISLTILSPLPLVPVTRSNVDAVIRIFGFPFLSWSPPYAVNYPLPHFVCIGLRNGLPLHDAKEVTSSVLHVHRLNQT